MRKFWFHLIALASIGTSSVVAAGITFRSVPGLCQARLLEVMGPGAADAAVHVDWRPFVAHLKKLGYAPERIPILMKTAPFEREALLQNIRLATENRRWTWGQSMDAASSARFEFKDELPLEYLAAVRGFDPTIALAAAVARSGSFPEAHLKFIAQRVPFWNVDRAGVLLALKVISGLYELEELALALPWLREALPAEEHPRLLELVKYRLEEQALTHDGLNLEDDVFLLTHSFRPRQLPGARAARFRQSWLRPDEYPPVRSTHVITTAYGVRPCLFCEEMIKGHARILFGPSATNYLDTTALEPPTLVWLEGRLVGVVKHEGDRSMLALRNVVDDRSHLMLVMGGVYQVSPHLLGGRRVGRHPQTHWREVRPEVLRVKPLRPLLNREAWSYQNIPLLLDIVGEHSAGELRAITEEFARRGEAWMDDARERLRVRAWTALLARIDAFRRSLDPEG